MIKYYKELKYYNAMIKGGFDMTFKIDVNKDPDAICWCLGNENGLIKSLAKIK